MWFAADPWVNLVVPRKIYKNLEPVYDDQDSEVSSFKFKFVVINDNFTNL